MLILWGSTGLLCIYFFTRAVHERTCSWDQVSADPHNESMPSQPFCHCCLGAGAGIPPTTDGSCPSLIYRVASRRIITHSMPKSYSPHLARIGNAYRLSQVHSKSWRALSASLQALQHQTRSGVQAFGHGYRSVWRARRLQAGLLQMRLSLEAGSSTTGMTAYGRSTRRQAPSCMRPVARNWRPLTGSALSFKCGWIQSGCAWGIPST